MLGSGESAAKVEDQLRGARELGEVQLSVRSVDQCEIRIAHRNIGIISSADFNSIDRERLDMRIRELDGHSRIAQVADDGSGKGLAGISDVGLIGHTKNQDTR